MGFILIGKGVDEIGWNRVTKSMMVAVILLFILSGFFRGFDLQMLESFRVQIPQWLENTHGIFNIGK